MLKHILRFLQPILERIRPIRLLITIIILWNYKLTAVVAVLYIIVNVYNHPKPVVTVTNNFVGLILSKIGYGDLSIYFSNKLSQ